MDAPPNHVIRPVPTECSLAEATPGWTTVHQALAACSGDLRSREDVRAVGMSYRRRCGVWTAERCVSVFVRHKRTPEELRRSGIEPLPRVLQAPGGSPVPVDIVEAGGLHRRLSCGARIGWRGLGTGDGWGTLGLVARDRGDGRPVAITAMHLTGLSHYPPGTPLYFEAADGLGAAPVRLGRLLKGTMDGVDAAKVSIDSPVGVDAFLPGIGPLRAARILAPGDLPLPVQLYGARSGYQPGLVTDVEVDLPADGLRGAFLVAMSCAAGDSGAVCCDLTGAVLGLYVGTLTAAPGLQVFCPITAVLDALECEF